MFFSFILVEAYLIHTHITKVATPELYFRVCFNCMIVLCFYIIALAIAAFMPIAYSYNTIFFSRATA